MAGATGLEPATSCATDRRSNGMRWSKSLALFDTEATRERGSGEQFPWELRGMNFHCPFAFGEVYSIVPRRHTVASAALRHPHG